MSREPLYIKQPNRLSRDPSDCYHAGDYCPGLGRCEEQGTVDVLVVQGLKVVFSGWFRVRSLGGRLRVYYHLLFRALGGLGSGHTQATTRLLRRRLQKSLQ